MSGDYLVPSDFRLRYELIGAINEHRRMHLGWTEEQVAEDLERLQNSSTRELTRLLRIHRMHYKEASQ